MHPNITIRTETPADYDAVEKMTRSAFYNLYVPGCNEHYLVRTMRPHPDFVPELDLVLELDGEVVEVLAVGIHRLAHRHGQRADASHQKSPQQQAAHHMAGEAEAVAQRLALWRR